MINIAIFGSGNGSNAQKIIEFFSDFNEGINIKLIISNKNTSFILTRAREANIPSIIIDKKYFYETFSLLRVLKDLDVHYLILAGFLWLIPDYLIESYPDKIINIHPALLPSFGGKGMYGMNVHEQVIKSKQKESGITIHLVSREYDKGKIIFQKKCQVESNDTPQLLAERVLKMEHEFYPQIIKQYIFSNSHL